jgi:hypothetical protein
MSLSYAGITGTNCAPDRSINLMPPNRVPQVTNPAVTVKCLNAALRVMLRSQRERLCS